MCLKGVLRMPVWMLQKIDDTPALSKGHLGAKKSWQQGGVGMGKNPSIKKHPKMPLFPKDWGGGCKKKKKKRKPVPTLSLMDPKQKVQPPLPDPTAPVYGTGRWALMMGFQVIHLK